MESSNLQLVRSLHARWERGDYSSTAWEHPEAEFTIADGPTPVSGIGAKWIARVWGNFLSAWEGFHHHADDYFELDDNRVLVLTHFGGRGKLSGLDIEQVGTKGLMLFELDDGKVTRMVVYHSRECGLDELGLKSPDLRSPSSP